MEKGYRTRRGRNGSGERCGERNITRTRMKEEISKKRGRRDDGKEERCVGKVTEETMKGDETAQKGAELGKGNHGTA